MNNKIRRFRGQIALTGIAVFAVVVSMIGGSYALFSSSSSAGEYNVLTAGNLEISYVEGENGYGDILSLNGSYPQADPTSLTDLNNMQAYRFNITNTGDIPLDYRIKIEYDDAIIAEDGCTNNLLDFQYIKYNFDTTLNNDVPVTALLSSTTDHIIYDSAAANQPGLQPNSSQIHEIRLWITSDAPNSILGKHFHGKVVIESVQSGVDMHLTEEYDMGSAVTLIDDSEWYVLEDAPSTSGVVKLLAKNNATTMAFDTENLRPAETNSYCANDGYGCNMYSANGSTVIKDASIKEWLEGTYLTNLKTSLGSSAVLEDLTVSLPSMEELVKANNNSSKKFNQTILTFDSNKTYLTSSTYWTSTAVKGNESAYVWYVDSTTGKTAPGYANNTAIGVRPVIVTSKLNIK